MEIITKTKLKPEKLTSLPEFSFADYERVVVSFLSAGYAAKPISEKANAAGIVFFRHDVDFFLHDWETIPEIENTYGIKATYYILPSSYNILSSKNRQLIKNIVALGHEIGLHFDPSQYPHVADLGRKQFEFEITVLEEICGQKITTVARHNVFRQKKAEFDFSDYIDPWDDSFLEDMLYISDSVRAWRDETLLNCFGDNPPNQVQLLTHPELWLNGACQNRIAYLSKEIFPRLGLSAALKKNIVNVWKGHAAGQMHDKRISGGVNHQLKKMP
jgi:hypothetical protein